MIFLVLLFLAVSPIFASDNMNVTVTGTSKEKPPLETLSAKPDVPSIKSLMLADDDKASAADDKLNPHMLGLTKSNTPLPALPLIPAQPFITQPLPRDDDPLLPQLKPLGKYQRHLPDIQSWGFRVVDELNHVLFTSSGAGKPTANPSWDGFTNSAIMMDPNRTYTSYIVYQSTINTSATFAGEAERFMALSYRNNDDEVIVFGERVYKNESTFFSDEGNFYLADLRARLMKAKRRAPLDESTPSIKIPFCEITMTETLSHVDSSLAERRKAAWKEFLNSIVEKQNLSYAVNLQKSLTTENSVMITIKNFEDKERPEMNGVARDPRPLLEDQSDWITQKEVKGTLIIQMRHDRLFRVGSAYLRDQAVPIVMKTMQQVQAEKASAKPRPILLRSIIEKPLEGKKSKTLEEDPKLDALRSKVLFMLLAKARYLD